MFSYMQNKHLTLPIFSRKIILFLLFAFFLIFSSDSSAQKVRIQLKNQQKETELSLIKDTLFKNQNALDLYIKEISKRLNKEGNRVQRVYLSTVPALSDELSSHLAAENHYMKLAVVDEIANESANQLALIELDNVLASANQTVRFFLVDPDGWAMMYYLNEHDGVVILKDLKYLLKYSKER